MHWCGCSRQFASLDIFGFRVINMSNSDSNGKKGYRSPLGRQIVVVLGVGFSVLTVHWYFRRNISIEGVDSVVNARLIDIKAPEDGVIQPQESSSSTDTNSNIPSASLVAGPGSSSDRKISDEGGKNSGLNLGQKSGGKQPLIVERQVKKEQLLFELVNERYSDLPSMAIKGKLNELEAELDRVRGRRQINLNLKNEVLRNSVDKQEQLKDSLKRKDEVLKEELENELESAEARYKLAKSLLDGMQPVADEGGTSTTLLTPYKDRVEERENEVKQLKSKIKAVELNGNAEYTRLTFSRSPSNYDSSNRRDELDLQINQDLGEIATLERKIEDTKQEKVTVDKDVEGKKSIPIKSEYNGKFWSIAAQPGKVVRAGDVLGQVAICDDLWVDAWVEEKAAQALKINKTKAAMTLHGAKHSDQEKPDQEKPIELTGTVSLIRSGLGRLAPGSDAAVSVSSARPLHYAQVRVNLETDSFDKDILCKYIGYTGKIVFKKDSTSRDAAKSITEWMKKISFWK
jgi:biotin carboxyl carrier protein